MAQRGPPCKPGFGLAWVEAPSAVGFSVQPDFGLHGQRSPRLRGFAFGFGFWPITKYQLPRKRGSVLLLAARSQQLEALVVAFAFGFRPEPITKYQIPGSVVSSALASSQ